MDIDVINRNVGRLMKHLPMLDEIAGEYEAAKQQRAHRSQEERASVIRDRAEMIKGIVSAGARR